MPRLLLTGCSGFIGQNFIRYLSQLDQVPFTVLGVDCNPCASEKPFFTFLQKDVMDLSIDDLSGCDTVLHLAARTGVRLSSLEAEDYFQQNVVATHHLLELSVKSGIQRFLFASSSSVYGDHPGQPEGSLPIEPFACKSFYALTKQQCEVLTHFYSKQKGLTCAALRFFTVYGPSPRNDMLIGKAIQCAIQQKTLTFFGNSANTMRSFTYVDDVSRHILKLLSAESIPLWSVWNVGNPESVSCDLVLELLEEELGRRGFFFRVETTEPNQLDTTETRASIEKSIELLQWKPETSIRQGIRATVESQKF